MSTAEARAAGCAIIVTDVGGSPEVVDFGEAGRIVPVSDPLAIAAELHGLMADPDGLADWQVRSRKGADRFTVGRMAADYDRLYRSITR